MGKPISHYVETRDNNFNLLRVIAALLVLFTHSFALVTGSGDVEPLFTRLGTTWGAIAVDTFFLVSGFLITNSFFRRKGLIAFAWARWLRIYPALFAAVFFCVCVVGVAFTRLPMRAYFASGETWHFAFRNSTLLLGAGDTLPGVFEHLPYARTIDGSLWTLPFEVHMYLYLAVIGCILAFCERRWNLHWRNRYTSSSPSARSPAT